jgi:hypothetical protein
MEVLPKQLTRLSQLTRLVMAAGSLQKLPAGPYLQRLVELSLFANSLRRVLQADAAAGLLLLLLQMLSLLLPAHPQSRLLPLLVQLRAARAGARRVGRLPPHTPRLGFQLQPLPEVR